MRVLAVYNFYFEYQLPRIDTGEGFSLTIDVSNKGYVAKVRGRGDGEDLFYEDIGISLSAEAPTLTSMAGPGALVYRVQERILDRLLVALELAADLAELSNLDTIGYWRDEAAFIASGVLDHLRIAAKSPRVKGLQRLWHPAERTFSIFHPYTQSWFSLDDGTSLPLFPGGVNSSFHVGFLSPNSGILTPAALAGSFAAGQRPVLHTALLVDAEERLRSVDYRAAILFAAMACEVAVDRYAQGQTKLSSNQVKAIKKLPRIHSGV